MGEGSGDVGRLGFGGWGWEGKGKGKGRRERGGGKVGCRGEIHILDTLLGACSMRSTLHVYVYRSSDSVRGE